MSFRLQYVSHLRIPFMNQTKLFTLPTQAPNLALLGNIGTPDCPKTKDFFQWADEHYQQIYWIPGGMEYSSNHAERCAWNERADACYHAIRDWKLTQTSFCQKMRISVPFSSLTLLATPGGLLYQSGPNHFRWSTTGDYVEVESSEYARFRNNEHGWIENSLIQTPGPLAILSHGGVSLSLLHRYKVVANCYGIQREGYPESSTGGKPWTAINMAGHDGFRPNAVFEFNESAFHMKQQQSGSERLSSSSIAMR